MDSSQTFLSHVLTILLTTFLTSSSFSMEDGKKEIIGGPFFSTYNPSEKFIDNYGPEAHRQFHELAPQAVDKITHFLEKPSLNPDTADVSQFVDFIGQQRAWVAEQTDSKNKAFFGKSRRMRDGYRGMGDLTPLFLSTYPYWRSQIVAWMKPLLEEMEEKNLTKHQINFKHSRLNISIDIASLYDLMNLQKLVYEKSATPEQAVKLANHEVVFGSFFIELDADRVGVEAAQQQALKLLDRFEDIFVIKAQFSLKMGDEFVPTSTIFMRYLQDKDARHSFGLSRNIVEELMDHGGMIYQHTLQVFLPKIENALGQYYRHILKWQHSATKTKEQNEKTLLGYLGFFHQTFDTLMPYARGSGAGAEWGARALARTKGFDLHLKEGAPSIVQEDLSQPDVLKFVNWYKQNVTLVPLKTK